MKKSLKFPNKEQVEEFNNLISQLERKLSLTQQILESKLGISPIQFKFLNQIALNPGLSPSELVNLFALNKATISLHLEKMKSANVIVEKEGTRDRRQKKIFLTESGTQLVQKVKLLRHTVMKNVVTLLGPVVFESAKNFIEFFLSDFDEKLQKLSTFLRMQEKKGRLFLIDIPDDDLLLELQAILPLLFEP